MLWTANNYTPPYNYTPPSLRPVELHPVSQSCEDRQGAFIAGFQDPKRTTKGCCQLQTSIESAERPFQSLR